MGDRISHATIARGMGIAQWIRSGQGQEFSRKVRVALEKQCSDRDRPAWAEYSRAVDEHQR